LSENKVFPPRDLSLGGFRLGFLFTDKSNTDDQGLSVNCTYDFGKPAIIGSSKPRIAILREQGVNGQLEMAAAFDKAGFSCIDVHSSDILSGRISLKDFQGLAACGGFSYGDVLGCHNCSFTWRRASSC